MTTADLRPQPPPDPTTLGPYRILRSIGGGGMGVVFEAQHAESGVRVALKTVAVARREDLVGLRREIFALQQIEHPAIARILDQGVERGRPWYAMELVSGVSLERFIDRLWGRDDPESIDESTTRLAPQSREYADAMRGVSVERASEPSEPERTAAGRSPIAAGELGQVLSLAARLCEPLDYLHAKGFVHRDLKPANVLLRESMLPVLVDFGIVARTAVAGRREVLDVPDPRIGSVSYMAPEHLLGDWGDARSDLYSLGCILFELLTGRVPFFAVAHMDVVRMHLHASPPRLSDVVEGAPDVLEELIHGLLAKKPRHRIAQVGRVLELLGRLDPAVASRQVAIGGGRSPQFCRPSFHGRQLQLDRLLNMLARARDGHGAFVALSGPSGVGKTRLALEVARRAILHQVTVVAAACEAPRRSQTTGDLGGTPLHALRPFLRMLADRAQSEGHALTMRLLRNRGPILALFEPALAELPGVGEQPVPAELPAGAARGRILTAIEETIASFVTEDPMLLVIDDLQWADELSLETLKRLLSPRFHRLPLMVIATARSDEGESVGALLGDDASGVTTVDLDGLDGSSIAALVRELLDVASPPTPFVEYLRSQSHGNPFFVAEYLRAAAEERLIASDATGRWHLDEGADAEDPWYPALPLPGSLQAIIERRLAHLSDDERRLLYIAAVVGHDTDPELLAHVAGDDERTAAQHVRALLAAQILVETASGGLRFGHDQLRDNVYRAIERHELPRYHRVVAEALERSGAGLRPDFFPALAQHWGVVGDLRKTREYLDRAGEHALKSGAHKESLAYLKRAASIDERGAPSDELVGRTIRRLRQMADAHFAIGELSQAVDLAESALGLGGWTMPKSAAGWAIQLALNAVRRVWPRATPRGQLSDAQIGETALAAQRLAERFYYGFEPLPMVVSSLLSVNFAERGGNSAPVARTYSMLGFVLALNRMERAAQRYFAKAEENATRTHDLHGLVFSGYARHAFLLGSARFADVAADVERFRRLAESMGDPQEIETVETIVGHYECYIGRLRDSVRRYEAIAESARKRSSGQHQAWGLYAAARALLSLEESRDAQLRLEQARALLADAHDIPSEVICFGLSSLAALREGDRDAAWRFAEATWRRVRTSLPAVFSTVHGYTAIA
ncbi:MAG: protein kinase, partial [Myxococcales bacterium]|nr:protein kinase [Myxococcales bacterium]